MEIDEKHKIKILNALKSESLVLFIGAGCSTEAGMPSTPEIIEMLKSDFPGVNHNNSNFLDVCFSICETDPYTKKDLHVYLKDKLQPTKVSPAHLLLPTIPLGAIFTTNYDTLIEKYYDDVKEKPYTLWTLKGFPLIAPINSRKHTCLYKLMGSVDEEDIKEGGPILTTLEHRKSIPGMSRYYERLQDAMLNGVLVFIGYSINDVDVLFALDQLSEKQNGELPYTYQIVDTELDADTKARLQRRRIIPIQGSFSEFLQVLSENNDETKTKRISKEYCNIMNESIPIDIDEYDIHRDEFDLITNESLDIKISDPKEHIKRFLQGEVQDWSPFVNKLDFVRDIYYGGYKSTKEGYCTEGLWTCVQKELMKTKSQQNKILIIHGMPGSGKSILLKRLGYDIYNTQHQPVIYLKNTGHMFENRYIEKITTTLWEKYTDTQKTPGKGEEVKFVLLIDNFVNHTQNIISLYNHLKSSGLPSIIITTERTLNWNNIKDELSLSQNSLIEFKICDEMGEIEIKRLGEYFKNFGFIQEIDDSLQLQVKEFYEGSFFITMYGIVVHSRKPLEDIIRDQYLKLNKHLQKLYLYVAAVDQFDGDLNIELLVRTLKRTYYNFESDVIQGESNGVFYRHEASSDYIVIKTHHKIIAKKTLDFFAPDPEIQKQLFIDLISNISSSSEYELNQGIYWVVDCFGPKVGDDIFNNAQKEELLKTYLAVHDNKGVRHHLGILQYKSQKYPEAYNNLINALSMKSEIIGGRQERDSYILTSLGNLFTKMAQQKDISDDYREFSDKAEQYLSQSMINDPFNSHAYHAHANLLKFRAEKEVDQNEKLNYLIRALEMVELGLNYSITDNDPRLEELRIEILNRIKNFDIAMKFAQSLFQNSGSTSGYFIISKLHFEEYKRNQYVQELTMAKNTCEEGLKLNPVDYKLLKLLFDIIEYSEPNNYKRMHETLVKIRSLQMKMPLYLKYMFAYLSFLLGYYKNSSKEFIELNELSKFIGEGNRNNPRNWIVDEQGNHKSIEGTIKNIASNKYGEIKVTGIRDYEGVIPYSPIAASQYLEVGAPVWFNLMFSYRGPLARNVRIRK